MSGNQSTQDSSPQPEPITVAPSNDSIVGPHQMWVIFDGPARANTLFYLSCLLFWSAIGTTYWGPETYHITLPWGSAMSLSLTYAWAVAVRAYLYDITLVPGPEGRLPRRITTFLNHVLVFSDILVAVVRRSVRKLLGQ